MKATTTVTTSTYYDNPSSPTSNNQNILHRFISPQQMLKRLIPHAKTQNKQNIKPSAALLQKSTQIFSKNVLVSDIQKLQTQLNNIHAQVIQSQNLLNVRDSLYGQLDILRDERQQIQCDVAYYENQRSATKQIKVNVRNNRGYKQMNDRLRRRISQIKQYIHKMELENRKIEENINYSTALTIQKNYRTQMNSSAWIDNAYFNQRQRNMGKVDDLISRLHIKQEQALQKVRRQQQQIDRRNQFTRASFSNTASNMMGSRIYGPSLGNYGGRRFYSPQYKY